MTVTTSDVWLLEHFDPGSRRVLRLPLTSFPFRIGRRPGLELTLVTSHVSTEHAQIERDGDRMLVRDLGSTNGTFVNRRPVVEPTPLAPGDLLHVASLEFRLALSPATATRSFLATPTFASGLALDSLLDEADRFESLLGSRAVAAVFQWIVEIPSGRPVAVESLGRGVLDGLAHSPIELFQTAAMCGRELELSRLFRGAAFEAVRGWGPSLPVFLNSHPTDLENGRLERELEEALRGAPPLRLVLEISEQYAPRPDSLRDLFARLRRLGIGTAYDDFGAGLARINELAEAPADYLKFDGLLLRDLDRAAPAKRRLLGSLIETARELGMTPIAEGIETAGEAEAAREVGFELAQGYFFHRPGPLDDPERRP